MGERRRPDGRRAGSEITDEASLTTLIRKAVHHQRLNVSGGGQPG